MQIILNKLYLENFKGITNRTIDLKDTATNISGENATGKTTIFDAYTWLLWNKDSQNKTDFNIKTIGKDGEPIHNLEHIVEGTFTIIKEDGKKEVLELKKVLKEKWTKKRGSNTETFEGHDTSYYINGVKRKLKEFNEMIGSLITDEQFKLLSNPLHFNINLKDKEKRDLILSLINKVSIDEIIEINPKLERLREPLEKFTINDLLAMNKATLSNINDDLKEIPIKINERNKSIRKDIDFSALDIKKRSLAGTITKLDKELAKQDNNEGLKELQKNKKELIIEQDNIETEVAKSNRETKRRYELEVAEKDKKIEDVTNYIETIKKYREKAKSSIEAREKRVTELRADYEKYANGKEGIEIETHCPTCNQELPKEDIEAQRNVIKSNKLDEITKEANDFKAGIDKSKKDIEIFDKKISESLTDLDVLNAQKIEEPAEEIIPQRYHDITEEITKLDEQIKGFDVTDNTEVLNKKTEIQEQLDEVNGQLAFKQVNEEAEKAIQEYEIEQKKLSENYELHAEIVFLCEEYIRVEVDYISEDINKMFSLVKFKLFETQINGGVREVCEATVNNVPFSDLNNAMKINAGIDIINTLSDYYKIKAPIFIDNAESVNHLEETDSQVVRLVVSNDKELRVS